MTDDSTVVGLLRSIRVLCIALIVMMLAIGSISVATLQLRQKATLNDKDRTTIQREVYCYIYEVFNDSGVDEPPSAVLKCDEL